MGAQVDAQPLREQGKKLRLADGGDGEGLVLFLIPLKKNQTLPEYVDLKLPIPLDLEQINQT